MKEKLFSVTIKEMEIQTFCSGGPGGQHQNKTQSGVRLIHKPSGAIAECREERKQHQNKKKAFIKLVNSDKFKKWIKVEASRISGELDIIKSEVNWQMQNVKIEIKDEKGRWIEDSRKFIDKDRTHYDKRSTINKISRYYAQYTRYAKTKL
jgi:protein subunit release factor B